ncbi:MAG: hypothetical protein GWP08_06905 [Nitrospiraceae bacterium]|nr:hypothetical protein [Nitrospiraceae bacterium]
MIGALLLMLAAADPGALADMMEPVLLDTVWRGLNLDAELVAHHRGYLAYLDAHPEAASAEEAHSDLTTTTGYRGAVWGFDAALWNNPAVQDRFDAYFERLATDAGLRRKVGALYRVEFGDPKLRRNHGGAMAYLRAHPAQALRFLDHPSRLRPTPDSLRGLYGYLSNHDSVREELRACFEQLDQEAAAHVDVYSWWALLAPGKGETAERYEALTAHFARYPHHFWVWHRRNTALARDPSGRDWIRYWNRRVRHATGLGARYAKYLKVLRRRPELRRAAETEWQREHGGAPSWPPATPVPELPAPLEKKNAKEKKRGRMTIDGPRKPNTPTISKPSATATPKKPRAPKRPKSPSRNPTSATRNRGW